MAATGVIGSSYGSLEGPAQYCTFFSTTAVSIEGLELAELVGVSWDRFLFLDLSPLEQVRVE